jgi:hypothetical protein
MFTTNEEKNFFMSHIDGTKKVLEYGSGSSTIQIGKKCKFIVSVEHQENWYNKINIELPSNAEILFRLPSLPYIEGGHDGTYDEFKSYVEAPLGKGTFDVILIDGRARVSCASIAHKLSNDKTVIFIHDFDRPEYQEVLNYLEYMEQIGTMAKFILKNN